MSGEATAIPVAGMLAVGGTLLAVGAFVAPGTLAAMAIKKLVDIHVAGVAARVAGEDAQSRAWQDACASSAKNQAVMEEQFNRFQDYSRSLLEAPLRQVTSDQLASRQSTAGGYRSDSTAAAREGAEAERFLQEIGAFLADVPDFLRLAPRSPVEQLLLQQGKLLASTATRENLLEDVSNFRQSVAKTLTEFEVRMRKVFTRDHEIRAQAGELGELLQSLAGLALRPTDREEALRLFRELANLLPSEPASFSARLAGLKVKAGMLKMQIDRSVDHAAFRTALARRAAEHLEELGYGMIGDLTPGLEVGVINWRMTVPEGEQILAQLETDGRISFRLLHESAGLVEAAKHGFDFYRRQEERWCTDLKRLFTRLAEDGYSYRLQDWKTPEANLPLVVVEPASTVAKTGAARRRAQAANQPKERSARS